MTTYTSPAIDFSTFPESDGEPMAETFENAMQMMELFHALRWLLRLQGRTRVAVGANQFLYYNPANGREHLAPDVYAALDVEPGPRRTWKTWIEGTCPDVVFEITSPSTQDEDLGKKRALYARLGAREYYIYDPQQEMVPPFLGLQLREGQFEPLPRLATGGIRSPLLDAELRPVEEYLRVVDPATGQPLPLIEETRLGYEAAEDRLIQEEQALHASEQARREAEQRVRREEQARREAEHRAQAEEQARREAEHRAQAEEQARHAVEQALLEAERRVARAEAALRAASPAARAQREESGCEERS